MDASALARDLLRWEQKRRELDELEAAIKDSVMQIGQTQTVGNVRATYNKGRKSYDYQAAADGHPMVSEATVELFTTTTPKIDWRGICKHAGIEDVPFKQGVPSVSLKLTR
jgi:hypothetical protein